jgi:hypothetical protein
MGIMATCTTELPAWSPQFFCSRKRVATHRMSPVNTIQLVMATDAKLVNRLFKDKNIIGGMRVMTHNTAYSKTMNVR